MSKTFITAALAAASFAAVLAGAPAQAGQPRYDAAVARPGDAQRLLIDNRRCYNGERSSDCRERYRDEQRSHRHYEWRDGRYQDNTGAAIAGFALGAAIAGSASDRDYYNSHRTNRRWLNDCRSNYHGWDSRSGTYLGSDGYRHYCTR